MNTQASSATLRPALPWVPAWLRNVWGAAAVALTVYVLVFVAWTFFHWGGDNSAALISDLGYLPVSLFGAAAAWRITADVRLDRRLRLAWLILGLAIFTQFLADSVWSYQELLLQRPLEELSPGLGDWFYLAFYPLALAGLLLLPGTPPRRYDALRLALDVTTVMIATSMVVWHYVIAPAIAVGDSSLPAVLVAAAYPIGDLAVFAAVTALLLRSTRAAQRSALLIFLAGLIIYIVGDMLYARDQLREVYYSGAPVDSTWIMAYLFFGYAALRQHYLAQVDEPINLPARALRWLSILLPFIAIVGGYAVLAHVQTSGPGDEQARQGLFVGAALLTTAVIGRLMVALYDNLLLNRELRAFSEDLEQRVEERTRELQAAQQELFETQRLASVGTLAAGVVHEVTNPINTILTATEALRRRLAGGRATQETFDLYLPMITRAGQQAARILQALRTYSSGSTPELAPEQLPDVIQNALLLMGYQVRQWQDIELVTEFEPGLPAVLCDRNQIAQVLINLLNNAHDAMPAGGRLTVRARQAPGGAAIEIADTGTGIAPEIADKIFDPFFTTKAAGKGTGLGLAIATGIIRAHNGTLTVRSDGPDQGAAFTLTLPAA